MPAGAQAACNKPLRMLAHLPMTAQNGVMTIPISVNGAAKQFVVDTGGVYSQLSAAVTDELKLHKIDSPVELYGTRGNVSRYYTKADVVMGNLKLPQLQLLVSDLGRFDGIFAPTAFNELDFDLDFAGGKLNLVSADHCEGKVVYWPAKVAAVVPFKWDDYHITVPVTVDGQSMIAILDTGANISFMNTDTAQHKFALIPDSPDMKAVGHLGDNQKAVIYQHAFKSLLFGGISVDNPHIAILKDVMNANADHRFQTGSIIRKASDSLTLPQVTIGMDVLSKLHVYLALEEKRVYLTEASAPATTPP